MNCIEIVHKLIKIAENTGLYLSLLAEPCEPELTDKGFKIYFNRRFDYISLYELHGVYFFEGEDCYGRFRGLAVSQKEAKEIYDEVINFLLFG